MRSKIICAAVLSAAFSAKAADKPASLDIKLGLWEVTTTSSMTGQIPITAETLAKLTPEQRASFNKMGDLMSPTTKTHKECITKEKLEKDLLFGSDRPGCSRTIVNSSASKFEAKIHCEESAS